MALKFSNKNAKTRQLIQVPELRRYLGGHAKRKLYSLDLLSGWSCPGAKDCLAKVYVINGRKKVKDGPDAEFRCFSASQEAQYPGVYRNRRANFDLIKAFRYKNKIFDLLRHTLPINCGILRYHVGGEFFSRAYLEAAIKLAEYRQDVLFYAYTKSLHFLEKVQDEHMDLSQGIIRHNFRITGSKGGKYDELIPKLGIRTAKVIHKETDAGSLPVDHDDSHAALPGPSFALLIHGTQKAGSEASKAVVQLKGQGSYRK